MLLLAGLCLLTIGHPGLADSTSPRLAAYYEARMLVCGDTAFHWHGEETPRRLAAGIVQVGVGRDALYALTRAGALLGWDGDGTARTTLLDRVDWFAAGRTGLFARQRDGTFRFIARPARWFSEGEPSEPEAIDADVIAASVGDSADYYVTSEGRLFVRGLAHRGQYGDGRLQARDGFVPVARDVTAVKAHTGHALILTRAGTVKGTGGNIYGPLGRHGIGDKAIVWGPIFSGAVAIATGSSHSLALRADSGLWQWGRDIGLDPAPVLSEVTAAAADRAGSMALRSDGSLWQWDRGEAPRRHFRCP